MPDWRTTNLDNLVRLQRGHDLPTSSRRPGAVPVVGAAGPSGYHDTVKVSGPGVVLGRAGASMGHATYCPDDFWPLNTSLYVTDFLGNDPRFVYYALGQIDFSGYNSGAAQPMLNRNYIKNIPITIPDSGEQRRISHCLGLLDDKIAINSRIAETMDELATAIFEEATGRYPKVMLTEVTTPVLGATPDRTVDQYWGSGVPWASAKDVANSACGVVVVTEEQITEEAARTTRAKPVPRGSVVLTARGTVGAVARVVQESAFNQSCYAFVPGSMPPGVLFQIVRAASSRMLDIAHGTVFSTVNMKTFSHVPVPSVPASQLPEIEGKLDPLHRGIESRLLESMTLVRLRDLLLPELMSGRLRVKDAEKVVEDAV